MTQEFPQAAPELDQHPTHPAASERVGVPAVDAVLDQVESVGELPVREHVAVFERAHEQLRQALDVPAEAADGAVDDLVEGR